MTEDVNWLGGCPSFHSGSIAIINRNLDRGGGRDTTIGKLGSLALVVCAQLDVDLKQLKDVQRGGRGQDRVQRFDLFGLLPRGHLEGGNEAVLADLPAVGAVCYGRADGACRVPNIKIS